MMFIESDGRDADDIRRQSAEAASNAGLPPEYSVAMRLQFSRAYWVARDVMRSDKSAMQKFVEIVVGRNRYGIDLVVAAAVENVTQRPAIALGDCHGHVGPVACQAGCSSCCHQHVDVSASEACLIALYLRTQKRKPPDLDRAAAMISGLSHTKRWARGIACPFLLDRKCSVYDVRPEPCRSHLSLSRGACLASWARRKKEETTDTVPMVVEPKMIGNAIKLGSDYAMMEAGIHPALGELAAMTAIAVKPNAVETWLSGDAVFPTDEDYQSVLSAMFHAASVTGDLKRGRGD
jgi:Putative zinc- or iron-chelating domain